MASHHDKLLIEFDRHRLERNEHISNPTLHFSTPDEGFNEQRLRALLNKAACRMESYRLGTGEKRVCGEINFIDVYEAEKAFATIKRYVFT